MEKMVGFTDKRDVAVLNKLLETLNRDKADARYLLSQRIVDKTSNYTASFDDVVIRATGTLTITLPKANKTGKIYWIKNAGSGTVTLTATDSTVDGSASITIDPKVCRQVIDIAKGEWDVV